MNQWSLTPLILYKAQLDGATSEYAQGNNFTAGVVFGKNAFDIYGVLRTLPEMAALAKKALPVSGSMGSDSIDHD